MSTNSAQSLTNRCNAGLPASDLDLQIEDCGTGSGIRGNGANAPAIRQSMAYGSVVPNAAIAASAGTDCVPAWNATRSGLCRDDAGREQCCSSLRQLGADPGCETCCDSARTAVWTARSATIVLHDCVCDCGCAERAVQAPISACPGGNLL